MEPEILHISRNLSIFKDLMCCCDGHAAACDGEKVVFSFLEIWFDGASCVNLTIDIE